MPVNETGAKPVDGEESPSTSATETTVEETTEEPSPPEPDAPAG